ncbi:reverse transcriptase N-terminal domain-containing protein [Paraburkholderia sp. RL17-337-BIB-A]|uniref:reverse transcriptase N-terminal domain-containing protein n=1 Tax=Paraburkholderia sp. RL17-337-BIB-A TaxID=3031636 RepID=UPI0038BC6D23
MLTGWTSVTEAAQLHITKHYTLAKAVRENRWGKAKVLQRLLTRSHNGKMLAVKRVTENRDKRTPGVDGGIWSSPAARWNGMLSLRHRGYRTMPLRRVYIPKSNGEKNLR